MYFLIHISILLVVSIPLIYCTFLDPKKNSFEGHLYYIRNCAENNANTLQLFLSHRRYNRTHIGIDMNITVPDMFDHTYELETEFRLWGDGGWKNNFFHLRRKDACNSLYLILGPVWSGIIDAAKCKRGCPVAPVSVILVPREKGFYSFKDYYVNLSVMPIIVRTGRFLIIGKVIKNSITSGCLEAEIEIKQNI